MNNKSSLLTQFELHKAQAVPDRVRIAVPHNQLDLSKIPDQLLPPIS